MSDAQLRAAAGPRRPTSWLRCCSQYSLRTLLAATTVAAAMCWWILRPEVRQEELAGTRLTLRRDVRLAPADASSPGLGQPGMGLPVEDTWENVGSWEVFGQRDERLVAGHYRQGRPHGKWTLWHTNGRLAAQGHMLRGAKTGLWQMWDEHGQLRSETEYRVDESRVVHAGQPRDAHDRQLAALAADLASPSIRRQIAAAARLEALGPAGVPLLTKAVAGNNFSARIVALRAFVRTDATPRELLPTIEPLVEHADRRLALWAMLAVYQRVPERREALVGPVVAAAGQSPSYESLAQAAAIIYRTDAARRPLVVRTIIEVFAPQRRMLENYLDQEQPSQALVEAVCRLGDDVLMHVANAFDSPRPEARQFAVATIDALVRRNQGRRVELPGGRTEVRWEIPECAQQVLTRARTDPDPAVRQTAEWVGRQAEHGCSMGGFGCVGFSGSPPF